MAIVIKPDPLAQMAKALGIDMDGKAFTPHAVQEIKRAMYRRCLTVIRAEQKASEREPGQAKE